MLQVKHQTMAYHIMLPKVLFKFQNVGDWICWHKTYRGQYGPLRRFLARREIVDACKERGLRFLEGPRGALYRVPYLDDNDLIGTSQPFGDILLGFKPCVRAAATSKTLRSSIVHMDASEMAVALTSCALLAASASTVGQASHLFAAAEAQLAAKNESLVPFLQGVLVRVPPPLAGIIGVY
jgi:hypothetical protein